MASMMTDRPGSVSTIEAAALAASVAPCTAMPISARFSAGASLTPSPVMPVMWPIWRMRSTIWNLCLGSTSAKPCASMMTASTAASCVGSVVSSTCASRMLAPMPSWRHVSLAMAVWSPVIILTSMPLATACSIVRRVSLRGGSNSGTMPM